MSKFKPGTLAQDDGTESRDSKIGTMMGLLVEILNSGPHMYKAQSLGSTMWITVRRSIAYRRL